MRPKELLGERCFGFVYLLGKENDLFFVNNMLN